MRSRLAIGAFGIAGLLGCAMMGQLEVHVLDSYRNVTYPDGQAAAIYGQYPPLGSRESGTLSQHLGAGSRAVTIRCGCRGHPETSEGTFALET